MSVSSQARAVLVVALALPLAAARASADTGVPPAVGWRPRGTPGSEANPQLESGLEKLSAADEMARAELEANLPDSEATRNAFHLAAADLERAAHEEPGDGMVQYELGRALDGAADYAGAVQAFEQARSLLPGGAGDDLLCSSDEAALAYDRLGDFAASVSHYDRCEPYEMADRSFLGAHDYAINRSNSAEAAMARGDLAQAIHRYQRAIAVDPGEPLHYYGLAVALDRDHQHAKALEVMRQAFALDPPSYVQGHPMTRTPLWSVTSRAGVFFIPEGDLSYYVGLGNEALGDTEGAARAFARFLATTPASRYHDRAREHLQQVGRGLELAESAPGGVIEFPIWRSSAAHEPDEADPAMRLALLLEDTDTREALQLCSGRIVSPPVGKLHVKLEVAAPGRVVRVDAEGLGPDAAPVAACVERESATLVVPVEVDGELSYDIIYPPRAVDPPQRRAPLQPGRARLGSF